MGGEPILVGADPIAMAGQDKLRLNILRWVFQGRSGRSFSHRTRLPMPRSNDPIAKSSFVDMTAEASTESRSRPNRSLSSLWPSSMYFCSVAILQLPNLLRRTRPLTRGRRPSCGPWGHDTSTRSALSAMYNGAARRRRHIAEARNPRNASPGTGKRRNWAIVDNASEDWSQLPIQSNHLFRKAQRNQ